MQIFGGDFSGYAKYVGLPERLQSVIFDGVLSFKQLFIMVEMINRQIDNYTRLSSIMINNEFIFNVLLVLILCFLSTFVADSLLVKIVIFLITALIAVYGYLTATHKTHGIFYITHGLKPHRMQISGVGHRPLSVVFKIKTVPNNEIVVEGLELCEEVKTDDRMVDGKLIKISLLSFDQDGFTIHLTNDTGQAFLSTWTAKYNKLNDFIRRNIIF